MSGSLAIWTGSAVFTSGSSTPFGTYDDDTQFRTDAPRVADWCTRRLGYPVVDIELLPSNIFACFEESVSEYSSQVNQFNIRNNLGALEGRATGSSYTGKSVNGNEIANIIGISEGYGTYAGVGGTTDISKGYLRITASLQEYDLQVLWADVNESGERIDVTRVFYEGNPAITRFFDPYAISGQGTLNLIDEFGFGSFSPAAQFVLMPMYADLLRIQAIEFNDMIRRS